MDKQQSFWNNIKNWDKEVFNVFSSGSYMQILNQLSQASQTSSIIDIGITESGVIRNIVWQGAVDIFRHYPLIGSGVETFAF